MFSTPKLTIAYIKNKPESAGRVLSAIPAADAAAFLREIPVRFGVRAFAQMNPRPAASIIQEMDATLGAAVLRDLTFAEASMILRQIDSAHRAQYLADQPERLRRNFEMTLAFPLGSVGAHMTTAVLLIGATEKASTALSLVKQADRDDADVVFVIDDDRKLVGAVSLTTLVRQPGRKPLVDLLETSCVTLSARSTLDAIANLDAWHNYNRLPVINRRGEVIGVLAQTALRRVDRILPGYSEAGMPTLADSLLTALTASFVGLLNLLVPMSDRTGTRGAAHGETQGKSYGR